MKKQKTKKLGRVKLKKPLLFVAVFGAIGAATIAISGAATTRHDLKTFYPNTNLYTTRYLEGNNYITGSASRSVLWFEKLDQWSFRVYNSGPEDPNRRCNWDQLSWWDDGTLRYAQTHHECPGSVPNDIVYENPIIFLPRYWRQGTPWSYQGSTPARYYENGQLRCTGTNNYTAEIVGMEQIAPNESGIHWRTTQTTTWDTGDVTGKCFAGYTTRWQEDYWLTNKLPKPDGSLGKGLKRSKGGNLDTTNAQWDVWFDKWQTLPNMN